MMAEAETPIYVPVCDADKWFSISKATIYRAAKRDEIKIHKAGNRSLLKVAEVMKWIEGSAPV